MTTPATCRDRKAEIVVGRVVPDTTGSMSHFRANVCEKRIQGRLHPRKNSDESGLKASRRSAPRLRGLDRAAWGLWLPEPRCSYPSVGYVGLSRWSIPVAAKCAPMT